MCFLILRSWNPRAKKRSKKRKTKGKRKRNKTPTLVDPCEIGYGSCVRTTSAVNIYFKITEEAVHTPLAYQISQWSSRVGVLYGHKRATTKTVELLTF